MFQMPLIYGEDDETQVSKIIYELINMFVYIKIFLFGSYDRPNYLSS